ncbi:MAG TPA: molecular chaperone TorD family protein [Thiolinea sp.]|nr:molecular chaperone TorD family protein [Thiolinea sp.]
MAESGPALTDDQAGQTDDKALIQAFCTQAAADLRLLADLHALELTPAGLQSLRDLGLPDALVLQPGGFNAELARSLLRDSLQQEPTPDFMDQLATDFAAIYLNGSLHAHPSESVWLDDEELVCQQPMFEVRACYARHALAIPDWRRLPDDHLVNELLFVAHLLDQAAGQPEPQALLEETAQFLDEHLLRWLMPFSERVSQRCQTRFYAALAMLTGLGVEQLRDLLAGMLDVARPTPEELEARFKAQALKAAEPQALRYFPGMAAGW